MNLRFLCLLVFLTMTACATSPEIRYYTLSAEPGSKNNGTGETHVVHGAYAIDAVIIPDLLDRPQIVLRSGANTVEMLDYDRWGAPLQDQIQRVLAADLSARLGANTIVDPGLPTAMRSERRITISILKFDPGRGRESVIEASWAISDEKSTSSQGGSQTYRARHVASSNGSNVTEIVATMSGLLTMIADDIAAKLVANE